MRQSSLLCLHRAPPGSVCRRRLTYLEPGGSVLAGLLMEWEWQWDVKNLLAADQGNTFPEQFLCVWRGEMYPVGPADCCVTHLKGETHGSGQYGGDPWAWAVPVGSLQAFICLILHLQG